MQETETTEKAYLEDESVRSVIGGMVPVLVLDP
jgi:hypothetical protein